MARYSTLSLFGLLAVLALGSGAARGGDEDVAEPKKPAVEKIPEDTAVPKEPEAPAPAVDSEAGKVPDYEEIKPKVVEAPPAEAPKAELPTLKAPEEEAELPPPSTPPPAEVAAPAVPRKPVPPWDPDRNVDYSRLDDMVEPFDAGRGVLPPALGFRGYRPNMIAVGGGDRVPGFGGMIEYSWNRVGVGVLGSYHSQKGQDPNVLGYGIFGVYGLYRWLPFDVSPYFLLGLEAGDQTDEPVGGMLGLGVEARIYSGWTVLLGWTYHSVMERGFMGGALGWSF